MATAEDYFEITNIVSRFSDCIDREDWDGIGKLFAHMTFSAPTLDGSVSGQEGLADFYRRVTKEMDERWTGDPEDAKTVRHKHVFTNHITEIAPDGNHATCQYYGTVYAYSNKLPFTGRASGVYKDTFERIDGRWQIVSRYQDMDYPPKYRPIDVGDNVR